MAKYLVAIVSAAALVGLSACDAEKPTSERKQAKAQPQQKHKPLRHEKLFADTRKHFAEQAAKTAENIKINAARLKKTMSGEPEPEPPASAQGKLRKQQKKAKEANDQPAKGD